MNGKFLWLSSGFVGTGLKKGEKINGKTTLGCLIRGFNRPHPIENLREKTWVDELLEQFPDCPNPIMFPASAEYYLRMRLYFKQQKDT